MPETHEIKPLQPITPARRNDEAVERRGKGLPVKDRPSREKEDGGQRRGRVDEYA